LIPNERSRALTAKKEDKYAFNPTFVPELRFAVRTRNGEFFKKDLRLRDALDYAELFTTLVTLKSNVRRLPKNLEEQREFLIEMGILVPASQIPKKVPESVGMTLSLDLLRWVPRGLREEAARSVSRGTLRFNRGLALLQTGDSRPDTPYPGLTPFEDFPQGGPFLWVLDPGTRMWAVYRTQKAILEAIQKLISGKGSPNQFDPRLTELLWHARVLVGPDYLRRREDHWSRSLAEAKRKLEKERFTVVRSLLGPLQIAALRKYYRALESEGYLQLDMKQVKNMRYFRHNEPLLRFIHRQSGALVRKVTGEQVLPSYCFLSAYLAGAELKKHTDRPQCAWNGSVLIDENPEVGPADSWPIFLETPKGVHEVRLSMGDAIFYSGQELPHWRPKSAPDRRQTLGLLHYVPIDFVGSLE
jgi:hypothetical protein